MLAGGNSVELLNNAYSLSVHIHQHVSSARGINTFSMFFLFVCLFWIKGRRIIKIKLFDKMV